jgi:hypothetical protein
MIHVILDHGEVGSMIAIPVGKENKREWDFVCVRWYSWKVARWKYECFCGTRSNDSFSMHETTHPMDRLQMMIWVRYKSLEAYSWLHISQFPEWRALRRLQSWGMMLIYIPRRE